MRTILLSVGAFLPLISGGIYVLSILRGKTKPQRMTYFLMSAITGLACIALWASGDTSGVWLAFASFIQALIICALALRLGIGGREKMDIICLILCAIGLVLWLVTGESLVGLLAAILADFIAVVPSLHKTIRWPETEIWIFYGLDTVAAGLILLAGPSVWPEILYPVYLLLINAVFVYIILRGVSKKHNVL